MKKLLFLATTLFALGAMLAPGHDGHHEKQNPTATTAFGKESRKRTPVKRYPFDFCFISNDKLGEMGKPIGFAYKGREIKVCCRDCKNDFDKNPEEHMKHFEKLLKEHEKN